MGSLCGKTSSSFSHKTLWAVRLRRHVPLAMSCRHQGLECRTQGERNHFEQLWTSITLAGRGGSREIAHSLESRHSLYGAFIPVRGSGELPPPRHRDCSKPSSYLSSLPFELLFLLSSPSDYMLQPCSWGRCSHAMAPAAPSRWTTLLCDSTLPTLLFPGTLLRHTKGKRGSWTSLSLRASWLSSLLFSLLSPLLSVLIEFLLIKATTTFSNSPCAILNTRAWPEMHPCGIGGSHGVGAGAGPPLLLSGGMLPLQLVQTALWSLCAVAAELRIWPWLPSRFTRDCISVLFIVSARSFMQMLMNARPSFAPSRVPSTPPPAQPSALEFLFTVLQGISPLL